MQTDNVTNEKRKQILTEIFCLFALSLLHSMSESQQQILNQLKHFSFRLLSDFISLFFQCFFMSMRKVKIKTREKEVKKHKVITRTLIEANKRWNSYSNVKAKLWIEQKTWNPLNAEEKLKEILLNESARVNSHNGNSRDH